MSAQLEISVFHDDGSVWRVDCGTVISVADNVHVATSTTPIVTYSAENAFVFDTGATNTYDFTIIRKNPLPGDVVNGDVVNNVVDIDPRVLESWSCTHEWSNASWKLAMTMLINRWQAKTNGCKLTYKPVVQLPSLPVPRDYFQRTIDNINVYIKSLEFKYSIKSQDIIQANMSVTLGSMCGTQKAEW